MADTVITTVGRTAISIFISSVATIIAIFSTMITLQKTTQTTADALKLSPYLLLLGNMASNWNHIQRRESEKQWQSSGYCGDEEGIILQLLSPSTRNMLPHMH